MHPLDPPERPRSISRPADAGYTLLGAYGDRPVAAVDRGGAVQLLDQRWTFDWWIAADDRWYTPANEAAVRQQRLGAGPVVQTAVRVPGGDILARCFATKQTGHASVVVEFENCTASPVGLALSIRPYDLAGEPTVPGVVVGPLQITVPDGGSVWLSSEPRDHLQEHDALVVPLPHRATTRVLLAGTASGDAPGRELPDADQAVKAWNSLVTGESRVELPDDRMTDLFDQARGRLALGTHDLAERLAALAPSAGAELAALCHGGLRNEAVDALRFLIADRWHPSRLRSGDDRGPAAEVIDGLAWAIAMYAPNWAVEFIPAATQLTTAVEKRGSPAQTALARRALARISHAAGDTDAATSIDSALGLAAPRGLELPSHLQEASETGSWADDRARPVALALSALRASLVAESWDGPQPAVDLFPGFPTAWRGGAAELHRLQTVFGEVSAGIRWHGYRPALLWEFERADHCAVPVRLTCRSLDPDWSTTDRKGDALLAGSADGLAATPAEGESFS